MPKRRKAVITKCELPTNFYEEVFVLAKQGMSQNQIADYFCIDSKKWSLFKSEFPEILTQYKKGRAQGALFGLLKLQQLVSDGDLKALVFYMTHCVGLTEGGPKEPNENIEQLDLKQALGQDPVEAARIYQQIMTSGKK